MTNLSNLYTNINNLVKGYEKQNGSDGASSNTVFTLSNAYIMGNNTLMVFVNGQKAEKVTSASDTTEYEETNSYTVTFGSSLQDSDVVEFYIVSPYNLSQDNFDTLMSSYQTSVGGLGGAKNKIINGNFNIWQRGTSFSSIANGTYTTDRWSYRKSGTSGVHTVSASTDMPTVAESGIKSLYSLLADVTTADASIDAADYCWLQYRMEGYDIQSLMGQEVTLSFWVKSTKTGIFCISFLNYGSDRSYIAEYTVNSSDTWEKKAITFTMDDGSSGTWSYNNLLGLYINFVLACGSNNQGSSEVWLSSAKYATSNQVNALDSTDNNFRIDQVQLEVGSEATPFEARLYQQELELCQRYYWTRPENIYINRGYNTEGYLNFSFPVTMRAQPTKSYNLYNVTGTNGFNTTVNGIIGYITTDWATTPRMQDLTLDAEL